MKRFLVFLLVLGVVVRVHAATTPRTEGGDELTERGKADLLSVKLPDFPGDLVTREAPREVDVRFDVNERGEVTSARAHSRARELHSAVVDAMSQWLVAPDVCNNAGWTASEVRAKIVFSIEEGRRIVSIKDARWFASGPRSERDESKPLRVVKRVEPEGGYDLFDRRGGHGRVVALLAIDAKGDVRAIPRSFSHPEWMFELSARQALSQWKFATEDGSPLAETQLQCIKVVYRYDR